MYQKFHLIIFKICFAYVVLFCLQILKNPKYIRVKLQKTKDKGKIFKFRN